MFPHLGNWLNTRGKIKVRERQNQSKSLKCFSISVINRSAKCSAGKGASDLWSPLHLSAAHISEAFSFRSCAVRQPKCHASYQKGRWKSKGKLSPLHMCASAEPLSKSQVPTGLVRTGEALKEDPEARKKPSALLQNNRSPLSLFAWCPTGLDSKPTKVKETFHWLLKPNSEADQMPFLSKPSISEQAYNCCFGWVVLHHCFLKTCNR